MIKLTLALVAMPIEKQMDYLRQVVGFSPGEEDFNVIAEDIDFVAEIAGQLAQLGRLPEPCYQRILSVSELADDFAGPEFERFWSPAGANEPGWVELRKRAAHALEACEAMP